MNCELPFKALADGTRQRILQVLVRQDVNVSELVEVLDQPQSTVSRHLKVLRGAGLIVDRREGTSAVYAAVRPGPNGDGPSGDVRGRLLEWAADQPLPRVLGRRLGAVLHQRRVQSETFFERVGHHWDQMRVDCFGSAFPLEALTALLPRDWTVADVGTGTGHLLGLLSARFERVIAVDPVPAMLDTARSRLELQGADNIDFRAGDLSRLPIGDAEVDLVLAELVLHHVSSPSEGLKELGRILRPGGRVLIVEQAAHQLEEFHDRMQDRWWGFDAGKLSVEVARAGFEEVRHSPLASAEPTNAEAPELFVLTARRTQDPPGGGTDT
jgi:ArsR family transcriptional regulator